MIVNIPNILTIFRILLTPIFILFLFSSTPYSKLIALLIFIVASITDAFDGYYARKHKQVTKQGQFLDPLADKILVSSAFISFALLDVIPYWMVILIILRDLFVTGLRMMMNSRGFDMITSNIAKAKTSFQIFIIITILLYLGISFFNYLWIRESLQFLRKYEIIYYLTFTGTIFTVYTGIDYIIKNRISIKRFLS